MVALGGPARPRLQSTVAFQCGCEFGTGLRAGECDQPDMSKIRRPRGCRITIKMVFDHLWRTPFHDNLHWIGYATAGDLSLSRPGNDLSSEGSWSASTPKR
jgi:hypothetical protein